MEGNSFVCYLHSFLQWMVFVVLFVLQTIKCLKEIYKELFPILKPRSRNQKPQTILEDSFVVVSVLEIFTTILFYYISLVMFRIVMNMQLVGMNIPTSF